MLYYLLLSLSLLLIDSHKFYMGIRIRPLLRRDIVHDTVEDVMARSNPGAMLENAREWITASRTTVTEGGSSDRHVDAVILYFLSVK